MKSYNTIQTENKGHIQTIWLSRAEKKNAIDRIMACELRSALEYAENDPNIKAVVVRGKGDTFCAGADLDWMSMEHLPSGEEPETLLPRLFDGVYRFCKPLIIIAHGRVLGGALGLVAGADYVLACNTSQFAFSEVRLGLIPATISPFVIKRIGEFKVRQLMLTGRTINASEAISAGLADKLGTKNELESYKDYLCDQIEKNAPEATKKCKQLIISVSGKNLDNKLFAYTANLLDEVRKSDEAKEGVRAFKEKRKPRW